MQEPFLMLQVTQIGPDALFSLRTCYGCWFEFNETERNVDCFYKVKLFRRL